MAEALPNRSGARLRLARLAAGLSQQELASAARVSRQSVAGLEAGRWAPSLHLALALARSLGMTVEELFGPGEPPSPIEVAPLSPAPVGTRVDLAEVGGRVVALPFAGGTTARVGFLPAAGLSSEEGGHATALPFGALRQTLVVAGCDPAISLLEAPLTRLDPPIALAWWPCGTAKAAELAAAGLVHVAGAHLPLGMPASLAIGREPPGGSAAGAGSGLGVVIGFATWSEGLVFHPSRAWGVDSVAEAARRRLRIVNREPGAEARSLLDDLRTTEGVDQADLPGYDSEVRGHLEVAAAIDAGLADIGPASEPAGLAYGLSFLPVAVERYELRIPEAVLGTREVRALLRVLASPALRTQLDSIPGYDGSICGELIWSN